MSLVQSDLLPFILHLADAAEAAISQHDPRSIEIIDKGRAGFDPVTAADRAAETAIRALIREHYPDHGIIGEEFGRERIDADHVWVIDPIDGTRAFITGMPVWGILIALMEHGRSVLGLNSQPLLAERFVGNGQHAVRIDRYGERQLCTRRITDLGQARVLVSSAIVRDVDMLARTERLARHVRMLDYTANCYSVALLAEGLVDIVIGFGGFEIYDIAAHVPIVAGAGGIVTALDGSDALSANTMIASSNRALHRLALEVLADERS
jgi:myo-inositol-1(or 4)-monophosphatase